MLKAEFLNPLRAEQLDHKRWRLLEDLRYISAYARTLFVVPSGFVTDFASVPRLPFVYLFAGNTAHRPAVVHDWLYQLHPPGITRSDADRIFLEAMSAERLDVPRRYLMWIGVRLFAGSSWHTGPDRYQILNNGASHGV